MSCASLKIPFRTMNVIVLFGLAAITVPASAAEAETGGQISHLAKLVVSEGYRAAPAFMLGLALSVALPMLVVLARMLQPATRPRGATRRYRPGRERKSDGEVRRPSHVISGQPFVEIEGAQRNVRCALLRDMLRIGREDDNDIRIPSTSVHRYHAAIHREDYDDWRITDLSGTNGNGLIVNGRRCGEARLSDGDLIQLGPGRLRFHAGFA